MPALRWRATSEVQRRDTPQSSEIPGSKRQIDVNGALVRLWKELPSSHRKTLSTVFGEDLLITPAFTSLMSRAVALGSDLHNI